MIAMSESLLIEWHVRKLAEVLSIDEILAIQGTGGLGDWIADEARAMGRL